MQLKLKQKGLIKEKILTKRIAPVLKDPRESISIPCEDWADGVISLFIHCLLFKSELHQHLQQIKYSQILSQANLLGIYTYYLFSPSDSSDYAEAQQ